MHLHEPITLYYDRDGNPCDASTWGAELEKPGRTVGYQRVRRYVVSTAWQGMEMQPWRRIFPNHWDDLPALTWETAVFLDRALVWRDHYATEQQALAGHLQTVRRIACRGDFWTKPGRQFAHLLEMATRRVWQINNGPRPLPVNGSAYARRRKARR